MRSVAESGKLIIWVYDRDIGSAAARAQFLFDVLPFQASSQVIDWEENIVPDGAAYVLLVDMVERTGYATLFHPNGSRRPNDRGMTPAKATET